MAVCFEERESLSKQQRTLWYRVDSTVLFGSVSVFHGQIGMRSPLHSTIYYSSSVRCRCTGASAPNLTTPIRGFISDLCKDRSPNFVEGKSQIRRINVFFLFLRPRNACRRTLRVFTQGRAWHRRSRPCTPNLILGVPGSRLTFSESSQASTTSLSGQSHIRTNPFRASNVRSKGPSSQQRSVRITLIYSV